MPAILENSLFFRLLFRLYRAAKSAASRSLIGGVLLRLMDWVGARSRESLLHHLFLSEDGAEAKWRESRTLWALDRIVNAVPRLLRRVYVRFERTLGESQVVCRISQLGLFTPYLICLTLLAMLCIHHRQWNNMYSLILSALALLLLWCRNIRRGGEGLLRLDAVGVWPVVFFFVCLASAFWSQRFSESTRFIFFSVTCALLVAVCVSAVRNEKQFTLLLLACAAGLIVSGGYGLYQRYVVGIPASTSFTDLFMNANMPGRVYSFFDNPNACANVMVFFTPLMLSLTLYAPGRRLKAVFAAAFLLGFATLMLTYSRGAWIAFAVGIFVLLLLLRPRVIPVFAVLLLLALPLLPANILYRVFTAFSGTDSSINSRTYIYTAVYQMIRDNPLTGVGLGTEAVKYVATAQKYYHASFPYVHAHSIYMEIWVQSGVLAIAAFVLSMFSVLKKGVRTFKCAGASPLLRGASAGCVGGVVASLVFGITDYAWSYPRVMALFWFLVAIGLTARRLAGEAKRLPAEDR